MITAQQILNLLEELVVLKYYREPVSISKNIHHWSKAIRELKDATKNTGFRTEPKLRFLLYLPTMESYTWSAYEATHSDIFDKCLQGKWYKDAVFGYINVKNKTFCIDVMSPHGDTIRFDPYDPETVDPNNNRLLIYQEKPEWPKGIQWLKKYLSGLSFKMMVY